MGQSTDAILCYGFQFDDDEGSMPEFLRAPDDSKEDDKDFEQFLLEKYAPELLEYTYQDYKKRRAAIDSVGVTLVRHCSCDYPMHILAATASVHNASRGRPVDLGQHIVSPTALWAECIRKFCADTGVEYKEPSWLLCSDWC